MHTLCIHLSEFLFNEFLSSFFLYFILEADTFSIIGSFLNWPKPNFTVASYSLCLIKKFCSIFLLSQIWVKYMFTVSGMMLFWLFPNCLIFSVTIGSTNSLCHCRGKYVINVFESLLFFVVPSMYHYNCICFLCTFVVSKVVLVWGYVSYVSHSPQWITFLCIHFVSILVSSLLMNSFQFFLKFILELYRFSTIGSFMYWPKQKFTVAFC